MTEQTRFRGFQEKRYDWNEKATTFQKPASGSEPTTLRGRHFTMRAYSQDGEGGDVFAWGQDDFDRDDAGDAEDVEFEDFAASSTPEEVCAKITAIAIRPFFAVPGMDVPDGPWAADFDPMTIELSPQPLPGTFEYELAADTRAAVLTALPGAGAGAAAGAGAGAAAAAPQAPLAGYRLPTSAPTIVRLHDPRAPFRYPRITALLNHIHCHLTENRVVTNRGLYYLLATSHPSLFPSPASVTASLQDVVRLLRCSRRAMGITTSGRGLVCGKIKIKGVDGVWRDYSTPDSPDFEVPGDINAVVDGDSQIQIRCDASYFLIVEKHSVFDKLKRERIWGRLGIVLITAKGFPDLPTRAFVKRLQTEFPNVRIGAFPNHNTV